MRKLLLAVVLIPALAGSQAPADVRLPGVIGDNMVLQQGIEAPIWGWAEPGDTVTVTFAGQTKTATADKKGKWRITLDPLKASSKGQPLAVQSKIDKRQATIENVLVGEVWVCSGQSNMAMSVGRANNAKAESASATLPKIRMMTVPRLSAKTPKDNCKGAWTVCSPAAVGQFSATAFFFGRKLHKELNVPVGLINSSVGGTPIEAWTGPNNSGALYNGMIAPLVPYAIRGTIWYQGERNAKGRNPSRYADQLAAMIRGWRGVWGQARDGGDFPFIYVQLPNFKQPQTKPVEIDGWVLVQEAMLKTLKVPNTGMAVTIDVGDARNIHPKNKQDVGKRLALWALAKTYGKDIVYCGPLYKSMTRQADKIILKFDCVGGGLLARGSRLKGFAIAGADKKFVWADAKIEGDTIVVTGSGVKTPAAVRYAWAPNPTCNLYNKEGLPASPFRTDTWPGVTAKNR